VDADGPVMRRPSSERAVERRTFLTALGAAALGTAGAGATRAARSQGTATPSDYAPLGRVTVEGAKEAVVDDGGETVFVAASDGFATVDVSDPADPRVLAERRDLLAGREDGPMRQLFDADVDGDRLAVAGPANPANTPNAVLVYDVSDPSAPDRLAVHERDHPIHNVTLRDGVAYLTGNDGERNPLVLLDDESGAELGRWSLLDADEQWEDVAPILRVLHDVTVNDERAYLAHWDAGTWVVDVSDPTDPTTATRIRGRAPDELADISGNDVRHEQTERPGNDHFATVNDDGTLLGIGMEAWDSPDTDAEGGPAGVELWDVSSLDAPERLATIDPPPTSDPSFDGVWTTSHNFAFRGDRLYTSWYRGGVRIYDVSDPSAPELTRSWRSTDRASFWAAQAARPGEFFVASSVGSAGALPSQFGTPEDGGVVEPASIYTFPDPPLATATDETGPGFGVQSVVGALGVLGAVAWLRRRS